MTFSKLCKIFPGLTIDLFASILNHHLPRYVSWGPDSQAVSVDAFNISWKGEKFYAFPPFSLIPRCLEKVVCDEAECVLVVPGTKILSYQCKRIVCCVYLPDCFLQRDE